MSTLLPTDSSNDTSPSGSRKTGPPFLLRLRQHLLRPISPTFASLPLLLCCFISGLADSAAYNAWSAFVSMQTGNTIFLALGASSQPNTRPYGWLKSLTSILAFAIGCAFFARLMRAFGHKGRTKAAFSISFIIQTLLFFVAAALATAKVVPVPQGLITPADLGGGNVYFIELVPLGLLAFQAGGQIVASRVLGHGEIPTTVLTSVYCDFASDAAVLKKLNGNRDRRAAGITCLLLGGIVGGWLSRSEAGLGAVLWLGGGLKLGISVAWLIWQVEKEHGEKEGKKMMGW
jgi:uncharacterized membrane protein YoaK (UPF0700 family)